MAVAEQSRSRDTSLYVVIGAALAVLLVVGLFTYGFRHETREARTKYAQLVTLLKADGLGVPADSSTAIRVLGSDGGVVCAAPNSALTRGLFALVALDNGAATVGIRPILADPRVLRGEELVLSVYCPAKLASFRTYVEGLHLETVIRP